MTKADMGIAQTLKETVAELKKYRAESEDNLRFLNTMERHFMVNIKKSLPIEYYIHCFNFFSLLALKNVTTSCCQYKYWLHNCSIVISENNICVL